MKTKRCSFFVVHALVALALNLAVNQRANAGTFFPTSALNIARAFHTATLLTNGQVLVAGGSGASNALASVELFAPASATWTVTNALNIGRYSPRRRCWPMGRCWSREETAPTACLPVWNCLIR